MVLVDSPFWCCCFFNSSIPWAMEDWTAKRSVTDATLAQKQFCSKRDEVGSIGMWSKPRTAYPDFNNVVQMAWPMPVVRATPVTTATLIDNLLVMFFLLLRDVQIEPYLKRSCINYYLLHHYYCERTSKMGFGRHSRFIDAHLAKGITAVSDINLESCLVGAHLPSI